FDLVVSISVLEHVMNVHETIREMSRITRANGGGLHIFPARYRVIEPHTNVPFGTLLRTHGWLRLWAWAGVKNSFQAHLKTSDIVDANYKYLQGSTNYLSRRRIKQAFQMDFAQVKFCEELLVSCAVGTRSNRIGMGPLMQKSALLKRLYSAARERVLWVE